MSDFDAGIFTSIKNSIYFDGNVIKSGGDRVMVFIPKTYDEIFQIFMSISEKERELNRSLTDKEIASVFTDYLIRTLGMNN